MIIYDSFKQGSEEWKNIRLAKITSSRFKDAVKTARGGGISETLLSYIAELTAERLTGEQTYFYENKDILHGKETEDQARSFYELISGNTVRQVAFVQHENPYIGSSPDGLIGINGGLEIKCPKTATQLKRFLNNIGLPKECEDQVFGQMWVSELEWVDFVSFDPRFEGAASYLSTRVYRDEKIINDLSQKILTAADLLHESIELASKPLEW